MKTKLFITALAFIAYTTVGMAGESKKGECCKSETACCKSDKSKDAGKTTKKVAKAPETKKK